jgi:hypothetical protein
MMQKTKPGNILPSIAGAYRLAFSLPPKAAQAHRIPSQCGNAHDVFGAIMSSAARRGNG